MIDYLALALALGGGIYTLSAKELMRGVLGLAVFFTGISMLFGLLGAWFLAVGQIFLFVGGVVTLFVLAFNVVKTPLQRARFLIPAVLSLAVVLALIRFLPARGDHAPAPIDLFASHFFATYGWMLNIAILLLFSAIIAAQHLLEVSE